MESFSTRKRKFSDAEDEETVEPAEPFENSSEVAFLPSNVGKRRKVVYDCSNNCSEDEETLNSVDSLEAKINDKKVGKCLLCIERAIAKLSLLR